MGVMLFIYNDYLFHLLLNWHKGAAHGFYYTNASEGDYHKINT